MKPTMKHLKSFMFSIFPAYDMNKLMLLGKILYVDIILHDWFIRFFSLDITVMTTISEEIRRILGCENTWDGKFALIR